MLLFFLPLKRRRNSKSIEKITRKEKELVTEVKESSPLLEEMEIPGKAEPSGETGFVEKANEGAYIVATEIYSGFYPDTWQFVLIFYIYRGRNSQEKCQKKKENNFTGR